VPINQLINGHFCIDNSTLKVIDLGVKRVL